MSAAGCHCFDPKELHDLHNDPLIMCEKMVTNKVKKLVPNLHDKKNYVIYIRTLDQALKHGLVLEKVYHVIEFNQRAWLKPYIDFNTKLRTEARNDFEKTSLSLRITLCLMRLWKTLENIWI